MKIITLTLYCRNIEEIAYFYREVLEFETSDLSSDEVDFIIGGSILRFKYHPEATPYHFAFNIPSNQENGALQWLENRTTMLSDGNSRLIDFVSWNAKAMYFYDPARNIVEFIARKNLNLNSRDGFSPQSVLSISEIGIGTTDLPKLVYHLTSGYELDIYDGSPERFCAIGDEEGLFICVDQKIKKWFPVQDEVFSSPFQVEIETEGNKVSILYEHGLIQSI